MPFCRYCGKENTETARFCVGCGKPVEPLMPASVPQLQNTNTAKNKNGLYIMLGVAGLLAVAAGIYFIVQNNKPSGTKEAAPLAPGAVAQNAAVPNNLSTGTTTVPFTNNNPTVINGEDVYKGYETGKFPVYIKSIYKHENKYYLDVDLVQVFEGAAVEKAKKEDGIPYDEQLDELYIRNKYATLRTYEIAPSCMVYPKKLEKDILHNNAYGFMDFLYINLTNRLFYIHLSNRVCYKMEEQYFP
jgi:zinc-ribbon domain